MQFSLKVEEWYLPKNDKCQLKVLQIGFAGRLATGFQG
jgi:hypothetical protein